MLKSKKKVHFPYYSLLESEKKKFKKLLNLKKVREDKLKKFFDKLICLILIFLIFPLFLLLCFFYFIEIIFVKDSRGPIFIFYYAVSKGEIYKKYKFRILKTKYINKILMKKGLWEAFKLDNEISNLTLTGRLLSKFYFDEIPQLYNLLIGDISVVGPRSLCVDHYYKDIKQKNLFRKYIKAGLFGLGHTRKGKNDFGNSKYEFIYLDCYVNKGSLKLLVMDISIICKSIKVIINGEGL